MRIALINTMTPYVRGGAEILVDDLKEQLELRGHAADLFRIPFPDNYEEPLMNAVVAARMLRLDDYDRAVAFKFPAYCVDHPGRVMWMFHQFRQVYELEGTEYGLPQSGVAQRIRDMVRAADNYDIPRSRHIYTNALEVSNRLKTYNGIDSMVLPPPLKDAEDYRCDAVGDYIFYPSRINSMKRQHLAVQAMKHTRSGVKLLVAGECPEPAYMKRMRDFVSENGLGEKVTIVDEWITDEQKKNWMANCLAGMYIPYKEDSCGFVTMEAQYSAKPVVTCTDSGGTVEFVTEETTGFFAQPQAEALAAAMDRLYEDREAARKMGEAARADIMAKDITWESTVGRLLL